MNKKDEINEIISSIFSLIEEAKLELNENQNFAETSERKFNNRKEILTIDSYKDLSDTTKKTDKDWSHIDFGSCIKPKDLTKNPSQINNTDKESDNFNLLVEKVFENSINSWEKKNLRKLAENVYQELSKENFKNILK